jgi:hypothetical protein
MQVDGSCHCGAITFTAEIDPNDVSVCHCTDCQVLTGTAFRVALPAQASNVKMSGEPRIYVKTTANSGARRRQAFCGDCGSPIYATADTDTPDTITLRVGAIRQRAQLPPRQQVWRRSALDWTYHLEDLPGTQDQG